MRSLPRRSQSAWSGLMRSTSGRYERTRLIDVTLIASSHVSSFSSLNTRIADSDYVIWTLSVGTFVCASLHGLRLNLTVTAPLSGSPRFTPNTLYVHRDMTTPASPPLALLP